MPHLSIQLVLRCCQTKTSGNANPVSSCLFDILSNKNWNCYKKCRTPPTLSSNG